MAVHVDEIHTDVVSTGEPGTQPAAATRPEPPGAADERWRETRCRMDWLASRVSAEGFED